jgi:hypothetical protein
MKLMWILLRLKRSPNKSNHASIGISFKKEDFRKQIWRYSNVATTKKSRLRTRSAFFSSLLKVGITSNYK